MYILLINPDDSENIQRKLQATSSIRNPCDDFLLQLVPSTKDLQWTKALYKAPKVTFGTIFKFLVDCKVLLKKVAHVENIPEKRENSTIESVDELSDCNSSGTSKSVLYIRTL